MAIQPGPSYLDALSYIHPSGSASSSPPDPTAPITPPATWQPQSRAAVLSDVTLGPGTRQQVMAGTRAVAASSEAIARESAGISSEEETAKADILRTKQEKAKEFDAKDAELKAKEDAELQGSRDQSERLAKVVQDFKLDPNRFSANLGTGDRVGLLLASVLSDVGAGLQGRAGGQMTAAIERAIDRDIRAQETDLEKKKFDVNRADSLYSRLYSVIGDKRQARLETRKAMLEQTKDRLDELTARAQSKQVRLAGESAANQLNVKVLDTASQLHKDKEESAARNRGLKLTERGLELQEIEMGIRAGQAAQKQLKDIAKEDRERAILAPDGKTVLGLASSKETKEKLATTVADRAEFVRRIRHMKELQDKIGVIDYFPLKTKLVKELTQEHASLRNDIRNKKYGSSLTPGEMTSFAEELSEPVGALGKFFSDPRAGWLQRIKTIEDRTRDDISLAGTDPRPVMGAYFKGGDLPAVKAQPRSPSSSATAQASPPVDRPAGLDPSPLQQEVDRNMSELERRERAQRLDESDRLRIERRQEAEQKLLEHELAGRGLQRGPVNDFSDPRLLDLLSRPRR